MCTKLSPYPFFYKWERKLSSVTDFDFKKGKYSLRNNLFLVNNLSCQLARVRGTTRARPSWRLPLGAARAKFLRLPFL